MNTSIYIIKIIKLFITERKFMVDINGTHSNIKEIVASALQGSVLLPTLLLSIQAIMHKDLRKCIQRRRHGSLFSHQNDKQIDQKCPTCIAFG